MWYGMVWYGMVWYGMVWYGMVWYGMVWYGMVWYGMVWYGMVWYGMVWYGMVWYGMVWYGMVWYGMVWYGMVWYGMVWYSMVMCKLFLNPLNIFLGHKLSSNQDKSYNDKPSPTYVIPRLDLNGQTHSHPAQLSPNISVRPGSLNIASSPLLDEESFTSEIRSELQRRLAEFAAQKRLYETKITELQLQVDYLRRQKSGQLDEVDSLASISDVTSLYSPYSTPIVSPGNSTVASPSPTPEVTPREPGLVDVIFSPKSPPPPPPPAPPSIPAPPLVPERHVKPTKPVVTPKIEMKPLFWNRIINSDGMKM